MLDSASPRWADRLLSLWRGTSAWTQGTEYSPPNPWGHTALLTHETNTCRLFKKYFNKTAWLAPGCPYPLSPCASPAPPFLCGRFLGRPKPLLEFPAPFPQAQSSVWDGISSRRQAA